MSILTLPPELMDELAQAATEQAAQPEELLVQAVYPPMPALEIQLGYQTVSN